MTKSKALKQEEDDRTSLAPSGFSAEVAAHLNDLLTSNPALTDPTTELLRVIHALKDGDLSQRVSTQVPDATGVVGYAIDDLADQLGLLVSELTRVASHIGAVGTLDPAPAVLFESRGDWKELIDSFNRMSHSLTTRNRELQTSTDQLRMLADAAPIGILQTDAENRFIYVNSCWDEITGISQSTVFGRTWEEIIELERVFSKTEIVCLTEDGTESNQQFEIRRLGEAPRIVMMSSVHTPDAGGGAASSVGIVSDITADTQAKNALAEARDAADEASRLKSDFLANMSHEIRTPMNGVIGLTDLLLETNLDPRQRDYAQAVRRSGEALLEIINGILDFSKVEAGKLEVAHDRFGLRVVVDDVADLLAGSAQRKGLELVVACERTVPAVVTGDPGRLRQVLTNLVGNAIKFTHHGEIVLRVALNGTESDAAIRFEVSDTGDGIAAEKIGSIFQPFVQADTSTTRKYDGTGLGLAISAHLITLMGGTYGVRSVLDSGSTFWFSIPLVADASQESFGAPTPYAELQGVTVLVVDDNPTQLGVLNDDLVDLGMTVTAVQSASDALKALQLAASEGNPFAVALVDWSLPGTDGLTLANEMASDPALTTPTILMTGLRRDRNLRSTVPGVSALLSKPIHRRELLVCVRVALGLPVDDLDATIGTAPFPALRPGGASGRILLAEDNLINQKVAVAMLSGAGYSVDTVPDGLSAVEAATSTRFDAILMDCQLPGLSGYEATAEIRALEGSKRHTPIIAMTAGARLEDRKRCLAEGMDGYLSKPVSRDALVDLLEASIDATRSSTAEEMPAIRHPAVGNEATLDSGVLDKLRLLEETSGRTFLTGLISHFVNSTDTRISELRPALEDGDGRTVGRIAHTIKEGSARLGGRRLAASCSQLERKTLTASLTDGLIELDVVEFDYRDLRFALMETLATTGKREQVGS